MESTSGASELSEHIKDELSDYARVIYQEHYRQARSSGEVVFTDAHHWIMERFDVDEATARSIRDRANRELKANGYIERVNERGRYIRLLK